VDLNAGGYPAKTPDPPTQTPGTCKVRKKRKQKKAVRVGFNAG
jgi:hypothetical protein